MHKTWILALTNLMLKLSPLNFQATRAGGTMVIIGMGDSEFKLNLMDSLVREVDIRGIFRYANE